MLRLSRTSVDGVAKLGASGGPRRARRAMLVPLMAALLLSLSVAAVLAVPGKPAIRAAAATFNLAPVPDKLTQTTCQVGDTLFITEANTFSGKLVSARADLNNMRMTASAKITVNFTTGDAVGNATLTVKNAAGKRIASGSSPIVGRLSSSDFSLSVRGMVDATMYNPTTQQPTGQHLISNYEAKVTNSIDPASHLVGSFGGNATAPDFSVSWNGQHC
jgi:hypothetical protein